jgi:hypothetical protein
MLMKIEFSQQVSEKAQISTYKTDFRETLIYQVSSKSVQREPSYFMRTDGQTDRKMLLVAFRNSSKALNNWAKSDSKNLLYQGTTSQSEHPKSRRH